MANKPRKGINAWKRARKKAAFIKANASAHRENRKARAAEREQKRLERWRDLAATQRAWGSRESRGGARGGDGGERRGRAAAPPVKRRRGTLLNNIITSPFGDETSTHLRSSPSLSFTLGVL